MKIGIIIETNDPEKAWNGVRFAITAQANSHKVQIFLMSSGVEVVSIVHPKYNVKKLLDDFVESEGIIHACGTCIKSRNQESSDVCPLSTMMDCLKMVEWADKIITF